jgi:hypothetical protein
MRHKGSLQTPEVTLTRKQGACRDVAVLRISKVYVIKVKFLIRMLF